jgi:hypothetical protein
LLVIKDQREWATKEITPKCDHGPNNYQRFPFVVWIVFGLCLGIEPTCIRYLKLSIFLIKLHKNYSKSESILIYMQLEKTTFDRSHHNECKSNWTFIFWKAFYQVHPSKWTPHQPSSIESKV